MRTILLCAVLMVGCIGPGLQASALDDVPDMSEASTDMTPIPAGGSCDPLDYGSCNDPLLVCTSLGICGARCGDPNGDISCMFDPGMVCTTEASNCIPPCMVGGVIRYFHPGNCEGRGLLTVDDGTARCIAPCFFDICDTIGGVCPIDIPVSRIRPLLLKRWPASRVRQ